MRITHRNQMMSQFRNMNNTLSNLTNSNNRMASQRKFDHAFEDVAGATRAMRLRKSIRDQDFFMNNIRDARGRINTAEDAMQTSINVLRTVTDRVEQGLNGTYTQEDRQKIAKEIGNLQEEVLALMNSSYTDHFVFDAAGGPIKGQEPFTNVAKVPVMVAGTVDLEDKNGNALYTLNAGVNVYDKDGNAVTEFAEGDVLYKDATQTDRWDPTANTTDYTRKTANVMVQKTEDKLDASGNKIPKKDADGNIIAGQFEQEGVWTTRETLSYHGMPVDEMSFNQTTGKVEWYRVDPNTNMVVNDPVTGSPFGEMLYNATNYVDIGLGHTFMDTKDGKVINPETVLPYTYSGVEVFGMGKTDGMSNNIYSLMGEIVESLENNDVETLGKQFDHLADVRSTLLIGLTDIGTRSNFIDDMEEIHKNDKLNYQTRQKDVEAVDLAEESMYNKNHEMAWMVTLQLGSKVLPSSLFDFIR